MKKVRGKKKMQAREKPNEWREGLKVGAISHIISEVHKTIQKAALKANLFFTSRQLILMSGIIKMAEVHCIGT